MKLFTIAQTICAAIALICAISMFIASILKDSLITYKAFTLILIIGSFLLLKGSYNELKK